MFMPGMCSPNIQKSEKRAYRFLHRGCSLRIILISMKPPHRSSPPTADRGEPIVTTASLGKRYGSRWAVQDLALDVRRGDVFGFLGPNGAGKSTTIRMLLSLIRPTTGDVRLFGHSVRSERSAALRRVG